MANGPQLTLISLLACLFSLAHLPTLSFAYDSDNVLVDYWDQIYISKNTTDVVDETMQLISFPYIEQFDTDKQVSGQLCWAVSWQDYNETCYMKEVNETNPNWILINPFDKTYTNDIIRNISQTDPPDMALKVVGLIFDVDSTMTAEKTYDRPEIMSRATPSDCEQLKPYCYNQLPEGVAYTYNATYDHIFIENCDVLNPIVPVYFVYAGTWAAMAGFFLLYLYVFIPLESRLTLQKSLLLLPALKALEVVLDGIWLDYCPWVGMDNSTYQYIQMAKISIITICYTVFVAIFYLLSKGWQLTVQQLNRNQATNLTMIMGAVYLLYSAYFLSVDFDSIYTIMSIIIAILYLGLAYAFTVNNFKNRKRIAAHMQMLDPNQENVMSDAFLLKNQMIKWIAFAGLGFCLTKFFDFAMINMLDDSFARARARIVLQSFDFIWITSVMIVCRARKEWPPYFTLSINEIPGAGGEGQDGQRVAALPPSMISSITEQFLFDQDKADDAKSFGSIGSDEAVMFVNPCNYTLENDDFEDDQPIGQQQERSAFDPDIIEEENAGDKGQDVFGNRDEVQRLIENGTLSLDQGLIKAELCLGFRDKKQLKREQKQKNNQNTTQRSSIYQRLFRRSTDLSQVAASESSSDSSDEDNQAAPAINPLNYSGD